MPKPKTFEVTGEPFTLVIETERGERHTRPFQSGKLAYIAYEQALESWPSEVWLMSGQ